jgi:hypothetical protein
MTVTALPAELTTGWLDESSDHVGVRAHTLLCESPRGKEGRDYCWLNAASKDAVGSFQRSERI